MHTHTHTHRCRQTLMSPCWAPLKSICMLHIGAGPGGGSVFVPSCVRDGKREFVKNEEGRKWWKDLMCVSAYVRRREETIWSWRWGVGMNRKKRWHRSVWMCAYRRSIGGPCMSEKGLCAIRQPLCEKIAHYLPAHHSRERQTETEEDCVHVTPCWLFSGCRVVKWILDQCLTGWGWVKDKKWLEPEGSFLQYHLPITRRIPDTVTTIASQ